MDWDEAELAVAPARARLEAEDPDGALSLLRELPADTEALLHAALIGAQIGSAYAVEFAAAAAAAGLRAALESDPETRWYAADPADFLVERGRHSEALATVTEGLWHHPDEPRLLRLRDELRARRAHGGRG